MRATERLSGAQIQQLASLYWALDFAQLHFHELIKRTEHLLDTFDAEVMARQKDRLGLLRVCRKRRNGYSVQVVLFRQHEHHAGVVEANRCRRRAGMHPLLIAGERTRHVRVFAERCDVGGDEHIARANIARAEKRTGRPARPAATAV